MRSRKLQNRRQTFYKSNSREFEINKKVYQTIGEPIEGGPGTRVYKARLKDQRGKEFAIKYFDKNFLEEDKIPDPEATFKQLSNAFTQEAHILRQIKGVVGASSYITHSCKQDCGFLVFEYLNGQDLNERFSSVKASLIEISKIFDQLLTIVECCHNKGIIHNDIKPANVMLVSNREDEKYQVFLIDFATVTSTYPTANNFAIASTQDYRSPELAAGQPTDRRSDVYSLGKVLKFLLDGDPKSNDPRLISSTRTDLYRYLEQIIEKATQTDPENRFCSALEMRTELLRKDYNHISLISIKTNPNTSPSVSNSKIAKFIQRFNNVGCSKEHNGEFTIPIKHDLVMVDAIRNELYITEHNTTHLFKYDLTELLSSNKKTSNNKEKPIVTNTKIVHLAMQCIDLKSQLVGMLKKDNEVNAYALSVFLEEDNSFKPRDDIALNHLLATPFQLFVCQDKYLLTGLCIHLSSQKDGNIDYYRIPSCIDSISCFAIENFEFVVGEAANDDANHPKSLFKVWYKRNGDHPWHSHDLGCTEKPQVAYDVFTKTCFIIHRQAKITKLNRINILSSRNDVKIENFDLDFEFSGFKGQLFATRQYLLFITPDKSFFWSYRWLKKHMKSQKNNHQTT